MAPSLLRLIAKDRALLESRSRPVAANAISYERTHNSSHESSGMQFAAHKPPKQEPVTNDRRSVFAVVADHSVEARKHRALEVDGCVSHTLSTIS